MKNIIILLLIIIVLGGGIWFFSQKYQNGPPYVANGDELLPPSSTTTATTTGTNTQGTSTPSIQGTVKEFTITGKNFSFSLKEMRVKKGDTVKVTFKNEEGSHDWNLDEFATKTNKLKAGEQQTIQFIANKAGTFEYYCSVGTHRQMRMKGNLIVEE